MSFLLNFARLSETKKGITRCSLVGNKLVFSLKSYNNGLISATGSY